MIHVLFGTETGNAELVADDITDCLKHAGLAAGVADMAYFSAADLNVGDTYVVVCSTYGDGELPNSAQPFYGQLQEQNPDLNGVRFAVFGLGDSYYATFNHGAKIFQQHLRLLGAEQLGQIGVHDASSGDVPTDAALSWVDEQLMPALATSAQS